MSKEKYSLDQEVLITMECHTHFGQRGHGEMVLKNQGDIPDAVMVKMSDGFTDWFIGDKRWLEVVNAENRRCARCDEEINFDPIDGDSYRGCWCRRWWCCEKHAKLDGWVYIGDSYETDLVYCNYCKEKNHNG